jgi:hypothetical protein
MYIRRWLDCARQKADGTLLSNNGNGTPQGGVISPLLSNLFLHYVLDKWLTKNHPQIAFVRYADDVVIHSNNEKEAKEILEAVRQRLEECKLRLNEEKTKIVYCQDYRREKKNYKKKFDFLGFTFKPQSTLSQRGGMFLGYGCSISQTSQTRIVTGWKQQKFHIQSTLTIQEIAAKINPQMRGVIRYYGRYKWWELQKLIRHFHYRLAKWVLNKYKSLKGSLGKAYKWIKEIRVSYPTMFYHWTLFKHI